MTFLICGVLRNLESFPVVIYLFKVSNRNTGTRYEISSKLKTRRSQRYQNDVNDCCIMMSSCQWSLSGVFIANFEQISFFSSFFELLTLRNEK